MTNLLANNSAKIISINIDPLQAVDKNFIPFLNVIKPYHPQILIELTERVTQQMDTNDVQIILDNISQAGFKILLDDIDMVHDTINLAKLLRYVVGLKLSADLVDNTTYPKINKLLRFLKNYNQCFLIGEGTSTAEIFYLYLNHGVLAQQGWHLDKEKNRK
ncbi:EAL domain-containing protein [Periweissella beninensis]|uniref:EAL domain-containing protein n=1 Tax=Periweissella beninensis TaxID=504936 RepID=A0ABT0VI08_9LACO|nr:EAL domain-containing protein [Periweissella beninensis]